VVGEKGDAATGSGSTMSRAKTDEEVCRDGLSGGGGELGGDGDVRGDWRLHGSGCNIGQEWFLAEKRGLDGGVCLGSGGHLREGAFQGGGEDLEERDLESQRPVGLLAEQMCYYSRSTFGQERQSSRFPADVLTTTSSGEAIIPTQLDGHILSPAPFANFDVETEIPEQLNPYASLTPWDINILAESTTANAFNLSGSGAVGSFSWDAGLFCSSNFMDTAGPNLEISGGDNPSCPIDANSDTRGALEPGGPLLPSPCLRSVDVGAEGAELTIDPTPELIYNPPQLASMLRRQRRGMVLSILSCVSVAATSRIVQGSGKLRPPSLSVLGR